LFLKLSFAVLLPIAAPVFESYEQTYGRNITVALAFSLALGFGFLGAGTLFTLPAILSLKQWKVQVNKDLDKQMLLKSLPLTLFNLGLLLVINVVVLLKCLPEQSFDWHASPSMLSIARDSFVGLISYEIAFFYVHRLFHQNKKLYAMIHKLHHTWTSPVALTAIYCHPLELIVSNTLPGLIGPILCGSNIFAVIIQTFAGLVHTTGVHSGYFCICDDQGMHDEHHRKFNVNYGVIGLMDNLYGSYCLPPAAAVKLSSKTE